MAFLSHEAGQSKGGTQKSADRAHSTCNRTGLGKEMVRLPGIEPGFRAWKARVITPRQQAQVFTRGQSWLTIASRFKDVVAVGLSGWSVEGCVIVCKAHGNGLPMEG